VAKFRQGTKAPENVYIVYQPRRPPNIMQSLIGKTRNPLKFAGVPQTPELISAVSELKFAILWGQVEEILLFNNFFRLSIYALVVKIQPDKVVRWCPDGDFLAIFCVL